MAEIYVSTDVETDGPIPGPHSMLSFASAAYDADKTLRATFSANLETLPGASPDPSTLAWWQGQPEAYAATRTDLEEPSLALRRYVAWVRRLPMTLLKSSVVTVCSHKEHLKVVPPFIDLVV